MQFTNLSVLNTYCIFGSKGCLVQMHGINELQDWLRPTLVGAITHVGAILFLHSLTVLPILMSAAFRSSSPVTFDYND